MSLADTRVFLSYPASTRQMWFGERCVAALQAVAPVTLNPRDRVLNTGEIIEIAGDCEIIVLDRLTPVPSTLLERLPRLRAVVRGGVDIRHVDVAAASAEGILVTQVKAAYGAAVAELVLGLMLDAARSITHYATAYRQGEIPAERAGQQLSSATVGIIGYGIIARHLVPILAAMGADILVHDPYAAAPAGTRQVTLDELMAQSDYVVPLAPATEETRNIINAAGLARMKPTAWLINCSRGDLVDEDALLVALDDKTIAGAAIDVGWAGVQMPSPVLARHPHVIATPHIGGMTRQSFEAQAMQAVEQTRLILQGTMPSGAVNAEAAKRLNRP